MDNELKAAIEVLLSRVEKKEAELLNLKRMVNGLCSEAGTEPMYPDAESSQSSTSLMIRPDQYYGKSPTVAAREYLEGKNRAVPLSEILDALVKGGFDFEGQGWNVEAQRLRHLGSSLGKNSSIFHRLPNDTWGLMKFYPEVAKRQTKRPPKQSEAEPHQADDEQKLITDGN